MHPPEAFLTYSALFHQDVFVIYPSLEEAFRHASDYLTKEQVASVKAYLDELISGRYTNEELLEIWEKSKSEIYVTRGNMIDFFRQARSYLN
ncbi:MAG: hypothetical protein HYS06_05385 [Methylocystis sp.]|nr:hypothetical protein [Methylocystis sp.]MBI3275794.1 hypothetical protein [Methylocystis sp.]